MDRFVGGQGGPPQCHGWLQRGWRSATGGSPRGDRPRATRGFGSGGLAAGGGGSSTRRRSVGVAVRNLVAVEAARLCRRRHVQPERGDVLTDPTGRGRLEDQTETELLWQRTESRQLQVERHRNPLYTKVKRKAWCCTGGNFDSVSSFFSGRSTVATMGGWASRSVGGMVLQHRSATRVAGALAAPGWAS